MRNSGLFIAVLISLGLFFGYVQPEYNGTVATLKKQLTSEAKALSAVKQYKTKTVSLGAEQAQISASSIKKLSIALPSSMNTTQLIFKLSSTAERAGFLLTNFSVSTPSISKKTTNAYRTTTIQVSGFGTYNAFRQFLNSVEHSLQIVDVTSFAIKSSHSDKDRNSNRYSYQMTLQTYWLPK